MNYNAALEDRVINYNVVLEGEIIMLYYWREGEIIIHWSCHKLQGGHYDIAYWNLRVKS